MPKHLHLLLLYFTEYRFICATVVLRQKRFSSYAKYLIHNEQKRKYKCVLIEKENY